MTEVLPIRLLTDEDIPIFGSLNVILGKLTRANFPVGAGLAVSAPQFKLRTILEHYDFGKREIFEQSLTLVKKEIDALAVPSNLSRAAANHQRFFLNGEEVSSTKLVWQKLLGFWLSVIKQRLWNEGFFPGVSQNLPPQTAVFVKKVSGFGWAFFDSLEDDVIVNVQSGKLPPQINQQIADLVKRANKKLLLPFEYNWVLDRGVKICGIKPYTPNLHPVANMSPNPILTHSEPEVKSAAKVILDLSVNSPLDETADGFYIAAETILDLNKPGESFEDLTARLATVATSANNKPVFFKLADVSEGMGRIRGALRLLHQKSLFDPMLRALEFARHKKGLTNVNIVVPFVRSRNEFLQIKRELAAKKLMRKASLEIWLEMAVLENIVNLEDYLDAELDGVVFNLDELISFLNGFDRTQDDLAFYKNETGGLVKFLEKGIGILHKAKIPVIAYGAISLAPQILEFLVSMGVWGVVWDNYEVSSARQLLHRMEKRLILQRS